MNIENNVLDVLSNATMDGTSLKLNGQLDRPLYVATNKVLEAAGGKWNRKAQAHIFEGEAAEIMDTIILTGQVTNKKQELGYFPTPLPVVTRLLELAKIERGMKILEPSAGRGAIAEALVSIVGETNVDCMEIDPSNQAYLRAKFPNNPFCMAPCDFLQAHEVAIYHRVVMNPPFAKQADIRHVLHAFRFLAPGGRLVSVMAAGVKFRTNQLTSSFRQFVADHHGNIVDLPENAFAESGTNINTVIVTMEK